jgi:hypothetical protein
MVFPAGAFSRIIGNVHLLMAWNIPIYLSIDRNGAKLKRTAQRIPAKNEWWSWGSMA